MLDIRCKKCNRLLLRVTHLGNSELEIKCPKCSYLNDFYSPKREEDEIPKEMKEVNVVYK